MENNGSYARANVNLEEQYPTRVDVLDDVVLIDFEKVAFGNIHLSEEIPACILVVHFGEKQKDGRVDRNPPGSVRYGVSTAHVKGESGGTIVLPPADSRNTGEKAIKIPEEWGIIAPFRWVEIEGWPRGLEPSIKFFKRRAAFPRDWKDDTSDFRCSDESINRIWDLCKYTMKATAYTGVFVDGDRERIPYEADAYLNQIGYLATAGNARIPRDTFDYLLSAPTWPTEWGLHMAFMAFADWMHTRDAHWISERLPALRAKLHLDRLRPDGLIASAPEQMKADIVDWPRWERDRFVHSGVNSVVNSFFIRSLSLFCELCEAVDRRDQIGKLSNILAGATSVFDKVFYDSDVKLYRDGESVDHHSIHANIFPVAFDIAKGDALACALSYIISRGMACSVYVSQYFMEALFKNGRDREAVAFMIAPGDRSWRHMVDSGTTLTWEAWDQRYKGNQDWNHAWGAAPANLLPRYLGGIRAVSPGWSQMLIQPQTGGLQECYCKVPTPLGPVEVEWLHRDGFELNVQAPKSIRYRICLPAIEATSVWIGREKIENIEIGADRVCLPAVFRGNCSVSLKR